MIVHMQAPTLVSVSRTLKEYLGWDKDKPPAAMVMCKSLSNRGLHTFHGMIGYCMKDAGEDHFQTVDHNVGVEDVDIGLEQLALHGQEESKTRIMLTQRNFAQKILMWRRWNYKDPSVPDWEKEFFLMLKTGRYFPCISWVVGSFDRGYDPSRMQSLWHMLVSPTTISQGDVINVFCQPDQILLPAVPQKEWFANRWGPYSPDKEQHAASPGTTRMDKIWKEMSELNEKQHNMLMEAGLCAPASLLVQSPLRHAEGPDMEMGARSALNLGEDLGHESEPQGTGKVDSPENGSAGNHMGSLWPCEWEMDELCHSGSECGTESAGCCVPVLAFGEYTPVYKRPRMEMAVE